MIKDKDVACDAQAKLDKYGRTVANCYINNRAVNLN